MVGEVSSGPACNAHVARHVNQGDGNCRSRMCFKWLKWEKCRVGWGVLAWFGLNCGIHSLFSQRKSYAPPHKLQSLIAFGNWDYCTSTFRALLPVLEWSRLYFTFLGTLLSLSAFAFCSYLAWVLSHLYDKDVIIFFTSKLLATGNRGPGRTPLDWTTRLKIAAGAARGLAFIHNSCKSLRLTHGNVKSTNILLDRTGNVRVSDFGLSVFAAPTVATPRSNGYRAPESLDVRKLTQKSDVYSFGVLLLELLTGKCPSVVDNGGPGGGYGGGVVDLPRWVQSVVREEWTAEVFDLELMRYKDIEEEMVGLLQIAMSCTAASPDQRPKISQVVKMIEEIRGVEMSPCDDNLDSVSDSPSVSEDACGANHD